MPIRSYSTLPFLLLGLILSGCSAIKPPASIEAVHRGGSFRWLVGSQPETLDPWSIGFMPDWEVASLIYEGLVGFGDQAASIRPALAESWKSLDGGKRWIFKLRADAQFHDDPCFPGGRGRKVTARDVLYTLERIARPEPECANWYLFSGKIEGIDDFHARRASVIKGISLLDDEHIEIRLTKPFATFLKILASSTAYVIPREAVDFYGESFGSHPVGTGPFRMVRWKPLEQIILVRNGNYWRFDARGARLPYLDSIDIRIKADLSETVMASELLRGETYLLTLQEKLYTALKEDLLSRQRCVIVGEIPPSALRFLGFSLETATPLARHADLRRAVAMVYDRPQLVRQSPHINLKLADSLVPPIFLNRVLPWHPFDPAAAQSVFDARRKELEASAPVLASNFQSDDLMLMKEALDYVAVKSVMRIRPANYYQYITQERPSIFRVSFVPSFFDPEDFYCLFYSKSSHDVNLTGYRNSEYDRILEAVMVEPSPTRRIDYFQQLEEILHRDVPAIYLFHGTPTYVIASPFVHGMAVRFVIPDFTETWLEQNHETAGPPQPAK
jgi:oligopeptide transport system substrate-binding protein